MATTVQKWGNSLAVRLPRAVAEKAHLAQGSKIEFDAAVGLVKIHSVGSVRRLRSRSKLTLDQMLAKFKGPYPHRGVFDDPPVGREII